MKFILSRHGNTFGPNDPIVWAGSANDLPLVEKGIQQAEQFADALITQGVRPTAVYCGPLQRTRKYAEILVQKLGLAQEPQVDLRLNEIDYGQWSGLTHDQVVSQFGEATVKGWDEHSVWPDSGKWGSSEDEVTADTLRFANEIVARHDENETVIVVSSNGRLRYFLKWIDGEFNKRAKNGTFKIKTGHIAKIEVHHYIKTLSYWNVEPKMDFQI